MVNFGKREIDMKRPPLVTTAANYDQIQNWNILTRWLHSYRFRHVLDVLKPMGEISVVELGTATGKLFGLLDAQQPVRYTGIEPYPNYARIAAEKFADRPNFKVIQARALEAFPNIERPDVIVALEVLEHIEPPECVRTIEAIAKMCPKLFIASVPVETGPAIVAKNLGSFLFGYGRHRSYGLKGTINAAFSRMDSLPVHRTSHDGWDWRWVAQTMRYHFKITEMRKFPLSFLPACCSATVFMICEPRHIS
jgi:hypothetical protein